MATNQQILAQTLLQSFQQGAGAGSRAIEAERQRAERAQRFAAAEEARKFREGLATTAQEMQLAAASRAEELFPFQREKAELGIKLARAEAEFLPQELRARQQSFERAEAAEKRAEGTFKSLQASRALDRQLKRDQVKANRQLLKNREAALSADIRTFQSDWKTAATSPATLQRQWQQYKKIKKMRGEELDPQEKKEGFKALSDNIKVQRAITEYQKLVESVKADVGFEDLGAAAQTFLGSLPGVRSLWGKAAGRARKLELVNQALIQRTIQDTKAEPNSQKIQRIVQLAKAIRPGDSDEALDAIIQGFENERSRIAGEFLSPLEAIGFLVGPEGQAAESAQKSGVDFSKLFGGGQ